MQLVFYEFALFELHGLVYLSNKNYSSVNRFSQLHREFQMLMFSSYFKVIIYNI